MGFFGPDKMSMELERLNYRPNETIRGVVHLKLDKPTKARKLLVSLLGKVKTTRRDADGDLHPEDRIVYEFSLPLDGEKEYLAESYPFEILIQSDLIQQDQPRLELQKELEEKLGGLGSILGKMAPGPRPIRWMVHANLDIPMKLDVKKTQDIVIFQE